MPYISEWVPPDLFLEHNGVRVFCTYKDDEYENGANTYSFTVDENNRLGDVEFDVRDLDVPSKGLLHGHPPFLSESDPRYHAANEKQRAKWRGEWSVWQESGEDQAIRTILREAIGAGLIKSPEET